MADRTHNDHYAQMAKRAGYPARSVYKLEEILQKKNSIKINEGSLVLDLGAAPGSWSLYLAREHRCRVVSFDLNPLRVKHALIESFVGDFYLAPVEALLASRGPYDAVVSDAAPATTGDRVVDCARSYALAERALELAESYLKPTGAFICKIFSNGDENELLARMKTLFKEARIVRPRAVRGESFEVYLVGVDYAGIAK